MRPALIALLLMLLDAPAHSEPAISLKDLWQILGTCPKAAKGPSGSDGSEVTVLFSIKRDGTLNGKPRITHSRLTGDEATQKAFVAEAFASVARCFPLAITDGLGGAIAGRPLRLRIANQRNDQGA